jgi:hypothetical protein
MKNASFPLLLLLLTATQAHATWYYPNVDKGSDIVMVDVRWPYWPKATYFALWNMATYPEGGPFYGGVAPYGPGKEGSQDEQDAYEPQLVWSFWGSPHYEGDRVRSVYFDAPFYGGSMSGEGATAGICGYFPYLRPNKWTRMVMRAWPSDDDPEGKGYVGWWARDVELDRWHCVGVAYVPCKVTGLSGNACFVENTGAGADADRLFDRRLGYHRLEGVWRKTDSIWVKGTVPKTRFRLAEDGTVLRFEVPEPVPPVEETVPKHYYTARQPDMPTLDQPAIGEAEASAAEGQVVVKWAIPASATPQLRYKIELFAQDDAGGDPIATTGTPMPHIRVGNVRAPAKARSARLTITDIFDQQATRVLPITTPSPLPATTVDRLRPGLHFRYYEAPEGADWRQIPEMSELKPLRQGVVNSLDDTISLGRKSLYAMSYSGFIRVPSTGLYIFEPRTSDGSRLAIDGRLVADNDGVHSTTIRRYPVALAKGLHAIQLDYFKSGYAKMDGWLSAKLWLGMEGPGLPLRPLGRDDFMCQGDDSTPIIRLESPTAAEASGNRFILRPHLTLNGHQIARIEYYRGRIKLGECSGSDLAQEGGETFETILPQGDNQLWARLWYSEGSAVDSNTANFAATDVKQGEWEFTVIGEQSLPQGVNTSEDRISLSGEGMVFAHRPVEGDFILTGRISDFLHSTPGNGVNARSHLGLMAANGSEEPRAWDFGMWDTAGRGMRGAADDRDLETSRMNRDSLGTTDRWIRIARRGMRWTAYTSPDGTDWRKVIDRIDRGSEPQTQVGVGLWTVSTKNKTLFHGTVDNLRLDQPGTLPEERRAAIPPHDRNGPGRITALVRGISGATLYARGNGTGVLASTDSGETWSPLNHGLTAPEALATRSIAICPDDPRIILRAGGCEKNGELVSGLWKSVDGGASWKLVSRQIDFDGRGPTALFGEVLSFSPHDPNVVAAGGESSGLYISSDRGDTWQYTDLNGERVTALAFNPYNKDLLIVGTCADSELKTLGLGRPTTSTADIGRIYGFRNSGKAKALYGEMADFGVTNVAFECRSEGGGFVYLATTRGMYYAYNLRKFYQRRGGIEPDTLYTAVDGWPMSKRKTSRILASPFAADEASRLYSGSIGYYWSPVWKRLSAEAPAINRGLTSILSHPTDADTFWLCNREGILKTTDGGKEYRLVQDAVGASN